MQKEEDDFNDIHISECNYLVASAGKPTSEVEKKTLLEPQVIYYSRILGEA